MPPVVVFAVLVLVAVVGLLVVERDTQPRARYAGAGVGALDVWQLVEHRDSGRTGRHRLGEPTETAERLPEREPGEEMWAPPLAEPPERTIPPDELLQRILDRLRAL